MSHGLASMVERSTTATDWVDELETGGLSSTAGEWSAQLGRRTPLAPRPNIPS